MGKQEKTLPWRMLKMGRKWKQSIWNRGGKQQSSSNYRASTTGPDKELFHVGQTRDAAEYKKAKKKWPDASG